MALLSVELVHVPPSSHDSHGCDFPVQRRFRKRTSGSKDRRESKYAKAGALQVGDCW